MQHKNAEWYYSLVYAQLRKDQILNHICTDKINKTYKILKYSDHSNNFYLYLIHKQAM